MLIHALPYIMLGYLAGSMLFARGVGRLLGKDGYLDQSPDSNPGTANAFVYGGMICGLITLMGDLAKGLLPVACYAQAVTGQPMEVWPLALVLAAPVAGHAFSIFHHFTGGKGIATSFGCLLGLMPVWTPALTLAAAFILLSTVIRVYPNRTRTALAYLLALTLMAYVGCDRGIIYGFVLMTMIVSARLVLSREERTKASVKLLWMH